LIFIVKNKLIELASLKFSQKASFH